jgi:hypothetical protein
VGVLRKTVAGLAVFALMLCVTPASANTAAGSTWYSDGTRSKTVQPGTTIKVYATHAIQGIPYRLVFTYPHPDPAHATHPCMGPIAQVVNPTIVYAGFNGIIGMVRGVVTHDVPGWYTLCFADASGQMLTATAGATITIAP